MCIHFFGTLYIKHILPKHQRLQNKTGMCNATLFHNDILCYLKITHEFGPVRFCRIFCMKYYKLQQIDWWKSVEIWLVYKVWMHTVITHVYQSFGFLGSPYSLSYLLMHPTCLNDNFGQLRGTCCFHFNHKDEGCDKAILQKKLF